MKTVTGNTYNIIETRTQNGGIEWRMASKTKSKLAELKELESQLAEIKELVQELTDSGEIANMNFDFDDEEEDEEEDEQAVLSASKESLDLDVFVESLGRKNKEVINADKFEHYINTHRPGKTVYRQSNRTNSGDDLLIQLGGSIEPSKETRRASRYPVKNNSDDFLVKLGGEKI